MKTKEFWIIVGFIAFVALVAWITGNPNVVVK